MVWYAEQDNQLRPAEGTKGLRPICVPTSAGFFIGDKMKRISLTKGQFAIVDDEDYEWLNQHKWFAIWSNFTKSFYAGRHSKLGKRYYISMAREILGLKRGDKRQSDHINHNTLNNQRHNLRVVTHQQNAWNMKDTKGYCWHKKCKKYSAQIQLSGKKIHLGLFHKPEEAHYAYLQAKKQYHKF